MEGAGRRGVDGLEGRRGLSGWRDRTANPTAQTQLQQEPNRNRSKPVPETETNRNEPWLYCKYGTEGTQAVGSEGRKAGVK